MPTVIQLARSGRRSASRMTRASSAMILRPPAFVPRGRPVESRFKIAATHLGKRLPQWLGSVLVSLIYVWLASAQRCHRNQPFLSMPAFPGSVDEDHFPFLQP